jgi:predicted membrane protein
MRTTPSRAATDPGAVPRALPEAARAGLSWLPLLVAMGIALGTTVYPMVAVDRAGQTDHALLLLLAWSMCAGFVRGVGFLPCSVWLRWLLSAPACWGALLLAAVRLFGA